MHQFFEIFIIFNCVYVLLVCTQVSPSPERVLYPLESMVQAVLSYPARVQKTKLRSSAKAVPTQLLSVSWACVCVGVYAHTHTHSVKYTYFSIDGSSKTLEELFRDFSKITFIKLADVSNFQSWSLLPSLHTHIALHHYPWVWSYHMTKACWDGAESPPSPYCL